ncbi:MAG TPA: HEAT repeat domain-containing protein [Gemmatimonadales bacterium]
MTPRLWLAAALLSFAGSAAAQSLARRVAAAPDGAVRLTYASRPGVCGDGRHSISFDCRDGDCHNHTVSRDDDDDAVTSCACQPGPVRLVLTVRGGRVDRLRAYVGGDWKPAATGVTDLGTVGAAEAARFLLDLAAQDDGRVAEEAVFPATLADSVTVWPDLFTLARNAQAPARARRSAVFWLGQAAGVAATKGLDSLASDDDLNRDVRDAAVFALSQQPNSIGVPALISIARSNKSPEVRKKAIFWLGQSNDPRALALFEELLSKP